MIESEIAYYVGIALGCWAGGWCSGMGVLAIRKFWEQI